MTRGADEARAAELRQRFRRRVADASELEAGAGVVVALSGGLDSVALLHLLRFTPGLPDLRVVAAHLDHALRPGSAADALWVRGLTRAWRVPCRVRRVAEPPESEARAREARYAFLEEVRREEGAALVLTAHHADDQAETVLFRVLRGTGLRGLRGVRERRAPAVWRPLLPFARRELEAYAEAVGLGWREDPTNADEGFSRNLIRNRLLPLAEETVAPAARRALARLARHAAAEEAAWRSLVPWLLEAVDAEEEDGALSFDRRRLLEYHPAVRARLLRALARALGVGLGEPGTRVALEFTSAGDSGRRVHVGGGLELRRELDRFVLGYPSDDDALERPLAMAGPEAGSGVAVVGGRAFAVTWGPEGASGRRVEAFCADEVDFPVTVRAWAAGDRITLPYGTKKLKKLFLEHRIPSADRGGYPVVADAAGRVLWIPDVVRGTHAPPQAGRPTLHIGIDDVDLD